MKAAIILLATLIFTLAPAVTPPFTGYASETFPVAIQRAAVQPATWAFSIWGLIYLWLIARAVFGLWRRDDANWQAPFLPHLASLLLGTLWLALAAGWPRLAALTITLMALATILAFLRADPARDRWINQAPLGLFAGWLTAATCVSWGILLTGYGFLSNQAAALAMLVLLLATALWVQSRRPAMPSYSAAVIWAATAVAMVNWTDYPALAWAALAGAALQTAAAVTFLRRA